MSVAGRCRVAGGRGNNGAGRKRRSGSRSERRLAELRNDPGGMRFSPLTQINRSSVTRLSRAWVFHTGDISDGHDRPRSGFETTPIFVDGTLFLTTPFNRVIALDPATGRQRWAFDPKIDKTWDSGDGLTNRGLATWLDRQRAVGVPCRRRLFEATIDARLIAIDAATGAACREFGSQGEVSLRNVPSFHSGLVSHDFTAGRGGRSRRGRLGD